MAQIARNLNEQGHRVTIVVSSVYYEDIVQSSDLSNITLERFKGVMDMGDNIELFSDIALSGTMSCFHISIFLYNYSEDCDVCCSNILVVPSVSTGSLFLFVKKVAEDLADGGHNVTLLVSRVYHPNINISLKSESVKLNVDVFTGKFNHKENPLPDLALSGNMGWIHMFQYLYQLSFDCESLFQDTALMTRLKNTSFDLIVSCEVTPCGALLAHYLNLPFILIAANRILPEWDALLYDIPVNPAYTPSIGLGLTNKMSFLDRLYNSAYFAMQYIMVSTLLISYEDIQQKYNIKPELNIWEVFLHADVFLFNTDFTFDFPRPFMPKVIFLGGGYLITPVSPLEKDLENFIASSGEHGIIVFSLGTYAVFDDEEHFKKFALGLQKLPQKVVAKFGGDKPPDYLQNDDKFKLMKWIPQNDLLAHPKTRVFVCHGGINGLYEALYHGIPIVGVPLFYDQHNNVQTMTDKGMGVTLDVKTFSSENLYEAVSMVITDPRYKENAVRLSGIHRDKPMSPKDTMIYWVEYVIKHGGKHLESKAVDLNFFQYYLIDVFVFVICVTAP
ncbi:UDP-glucuronosyltransferase 2C1-like [Glandiceps talaboti]